jgi:hypothetical protein
VDPKVMKNSDRGESAHVGTDADNFASVVGIRAHETVARLLLGGELPNDRLELVTHISTVVRDVFASHEPQRRHRAMLTEVRSYVAAYLHLYAPSAPWKLMDAEVRTPGGRIDLVFTNQQTGEVLADELKFGLSGSLNASIVKQVTCYLTGGTERWGERFVGLRLCNVASPSTSRFFEAGKGGHSIALSKSKFAYLGAS